MQTGMNARAKLVRRCMIQKFNSDAEAKETILQDLDGFVSKPEDRVLFGLGPKIKWLSREGF